MNILGILIWVVAILIALVPVVGLLAELIDHYKTKGIIEYERGKNGKEK